MTRVRTHGRVFSAFSAQFFSAPSTKRVGRHHPSLVALLAIVIDFLGVSRQHE